MVGGQELGAGHLLNVKRIAHNDCIQSLRVTVYTVNIDLIAVKLNDFHREKKLCKSCSVGLTQALAE